MEWISVKDRLPKDIPLMQPWQQPSPSYNWVPVASSDGKWSIARYAHKNVDRKLIETWEFYDQQDHDDTTCIAAMAGDITCTMTLDEIEFWLDIWENMP